MNTENTTPEPERKAQSAGPLRSLMDRLGRRRAKQGPFLADNVRCHHRRGRGHHHGSPRIGCPGGHRGPDPGAGNGSAVGLSGSVVPPRSGQQQPGQPQGRNDSDPSEQAPQEPGGPGGPIAGNDFLRWSDRLRDVEEMVADPELRAEWEVEVAEMRDRINGMRHLLVETLNEKGVEQDFSFITQQRGMFSFSGLNPAQVKALRDKYSIYIVGSGRINVAGITEANVDYLASSIAAVL